MKFRAAKIAKASIAGLIAASLAVGPVAASSRESVQRVTQAYKAWLDAEGHEQTGRARILLKTNRIYVQVSYEDGTSRLVYTADGTVFLGEDVMMASADDESATCRVRILCSEDDNKGRSRKSSPSRKNDNPKTVVAGSDKTDSDSDKGDTDKTDAKKGTDEPKKVTEEEPKKGSDAIKPNEKEKTSDKKTGTDKKRNSEEPAD